jgi:hypothetical protein
MAICACSTVSFHGCNTSPGRVCAAACVAPISPNRIIITMLVSRLNVRGSGRRCGRAGTGMAWRSRRGMRRSRLRRRCERTGWGGNITWSSANGSVCAACWRIAAAVRRGASSSAAYCG